MPSLAHRLRQWLRLRHAGPTSAGQMTRLFTRLYQRNAWGSAESVSGPGSTLARAADFTDALVALLVALPARSLLDAPCGDFHWAGPMADAVDEYVGLDVVPALIERLARAHARPGRRFVCADLTRAALPAVDVILCRDALVHFSYADTARALANFRRSGARYLLTTTFVAHPANRDMPTGGWQPLNLQAPPFGFPPPLAVVDEHCVHSGGVYRDKRLALWAVADLPRVEGEG